ncbi:hypothetical protein ABPG77_009106 [Micractinium sp. CCAP 211/92]
MQCCSLLAPAARAARLAARAEEESSSSGAAAAAAAESADEVAAEQLLRRRKGGKGGKGGSSGSDSGKQGPTVISPIRDQVYGGGPLTAEQKAENTVVATLAVLFFVILAEGIFVAGSGFMSEGLDQFAQDVVLPAFTPTLGLFLAISTLYGLWKASWDWGHTRAAPSEKQ